jgi:hypothetical protein
MKQMLMMAMAALVACGVMHAQTAPQPASVPQEQTPPAADASAGLIDLNAMTFSCPKAALNAAAREAAKVVSQGTYQFSYFNIVNDSHHSLFEVHFKSNYEGESELKYCVAMYCQQGWDPKTTKTTVTRMTEAPRPAARAAHASGCREEHAPVKVKPRTTTQQPAEPAAAAKRR